MSYPCLCPCNCEQGYEYQAATICSECQNDQHQNERQVSSEELTKAICLTIEWLTDNNVHTLAALLEWNAADMIELYTDKTTAQYDANAMIQAYKAAQMIISGTQ